MNGIIHFRVESAIAFACDCHAGTVDKAGAPYIYHPLRVMFSLEEDDDRIAAVLHDVVEDCGVSLETIERMFGSAVAQAVDHLTRRTGEDYADFIQRCARDPIACRVKLADLADNMNLDRLGRLPTEQDLARNRKYAAAWETLTDLATA